MEKLVKETPYLYLITFVTLQEGKEVTGSTIVAFKEEAPLWKAYAILNEANKDGQMFTIISVQKLT